MLVQLLVGQHAAAAIGWRAGRSIGTPAHDKGSNMRGNSVEEKGKGKTHGVERLQGINTRKIRA
jgi:hypothetical protein